MTETAAPARFVEGGTATARSFVNSDTVWTFEVVKRTPAFVTLRDVDTGDTYRVKVHTDPVSGDEWAKPFGTYSLCEIARPVTGAEVAR